MKEQDSYDHILKYTGLLGGVQVIHLLLSIVRNKFTAIFIGSAGIGLADIYTRATTLMGSLTNMGLGLSAVQRLSQVYEQGDETATTRYVGVVRTWVLITAVFGWAVTMLASPLLSRMLTDSSEQVPHFLVLSVIVPMLTVTGGEIAILKATRKLRRLAAVTAISAFFSLLITIPIYWLSGIYGIVPVLVLTTFALMLINLHAGTRNYPYRVSLRTEGMAGEGRKLLRMGVVYVLAGVMGAVSEMLVRMFMLEASDFAQVGYYAVGFTLTVSYSHLIFTALDADFFPRLSASIADTKRSNMLANRQIDVLVLLMTPFLIFFALALPLVVRLLYTSEFLIVVPMVVCALSCMFFKAVCTPIAYLALARADSIAFFLVELAYNLVFIAAVIGGYRYNGLMGAGLGLTLANLFDLLMIFTVYNMRYRFRFERRTLLRIAVQFLLLVAGLALAWQHNLAVRFAGGGLVLAAAIVYSYKFLQRETDILPKLARLIRRR